MIAKIVRQYYILAVLLYGGVNATAAMYTTFLISRGLDMSDVYLVRFAYFATLLLFEFPTGVLADWLGRKTLILVSCALFVPGMIVYASCDGFWAFVCAEVLIAMAQACANGACEAWFVDRINHHNGGEALLNTRFASAWVYRHFSALLAGAIGGWLADKSMLYPWIFACIFFGVAFLFALVSMREEYFAQKHLPMCQVWSDLKSRARTSLIYGLTNANLRFIMLVVFGVYFAVMAPNLMWQPYFAQWVPDNTTQGLIWVGISVCLMFGALLAPQLVNGLASERRALIVCCAIIAGGIIGMACFGFPMALVAFLAYQVARGALGATKDPFLHHSIEGKEQRAAVSSFESASYHGGGAIGLLTWGVLMKEASIQTSLMASGAMLLGLVILLAPFVFLWKNGRRK